MAKAADCLISGVWKDSSQRITHVFLHIDDIGTSFYRGVKKTEAEVIQLINSGKTVKTITWNYPGWRIGADVRVGRRNSNDFLITDPNASVRDNLDNMLPMSFFIL